MKTDRQSLETSRIAERSNFLFDGYLIAEYKSGRPAGRDGDGPPGHRLPRGRGLDPVAVPALAPGEFGLRGNEFAVERLSEDGQIRDIFLFGW